MYRSLNSSRPRLLAAFVIFIFSAALYAGPQSSADSQDPVSLLNEKLQKGETKLAYNQQLGYLPSVLKALDIPVSSQGLVFSKTSFQAPRIHPQTPRAIYFNDSVYVGYISGGDFLELASVDPKKGAVFFLLSQDSSNKPTFSKRDDCLQCHQSSVTFEYPGFLMRSVWTLPNGYPDLQYGDFLSEDTTPMKNRWGGWYVSGTVENDSHMGNFLVRENPENADLTPTSNVTDLDKLLNTNHYLSPHSDIVALMVLEHQVRIHNLITQAQIASEKALEQNVVLAKLFGLKPGEWTDSTKTRINDVSDELVRGLLFRDEYRLKGEVKGTSSFAEDFQKLGPRDSKGRSLRDLDLHTRLLKHPCSWLIYSDAFNALRPEVRQIVYRRIYEVLKSDADQPTLEILSATKPEFPQAIASVVKITH